MYCSNPQTHGVRLFVSAKILPLNCFTLRQCRISCMIFQKTLPRKTSAITLLHHIDYTASLSQYQGRYVGKCLYRAVHAWTNWVIILLFLEPKYGIAFHLKFADSCELLLNKKTWDLRQKNVFKFSTPKTVMLTRPLICWIRKRSSSQDNLNLAHLT